MAITVLEFLPKYGQKRLWKHHEEVPLKDLVQLYRECREDETAVRYILHILPYFLKYARDYDCNLDDLMSIISQLNKLRSIVLISGHVTEVEFSADQNDSTFDLE